jgi:ubiquinone/menaquinone biosynthesis C-methylase UbiE
MYRRRVELCLNECLGGEDILEIGFGTGVTFLNLSDKYSRIYGLDLTASVKEVALVYERRGLNPILQNGSVLAMPYADNYFDSVLLISILEHLKPRELGLAFSEIRRVLKPGGQMIYGVPTDNTFMRLCFLMLGYNIRKHHFSSERAVAQAASEIFRLVHYTPMKSFLPLMGNVYEIGHFIK